mgnify:CR=1 FL=1|tara:strand:+ start:216 stop:533 length:318 start_codon:yes stop_codon:yes gene_type:complete
MPRYHNINGNNVQFTAEEETARDIEEQAWLDDTSNRKLKNIKKLRLEKLKETDWWVLRGDITEEQKTWRQSLRDIPANHTDESAYDILLVRDEDNNLTHEIWTKP